MGKRSSFLFFSCVLLLSACGGGTAVVVPAGGEGVGARSFSSGQCFVSYNDTVSVYMEPGMDAIPVGQGLPGRFEMQAVRALEGGGVFYQTQESLWVRVDTVEYTTEGDCAAPE